MLGELADALVAAVGVISLVFEAPQKSQQVWLIQRYGAEVNWQYSSRRYSRLHTALRAALRHRQASTPAVLQEEWTCLPAGAV